MNTHSRAHPIGTCAQRSPCFREIPSTTLMTPLNYPSSKQAIGRTPYWLTSIIAMSTTTGTVHTPHIHRLATCLRIQKTYRPRLRLLCSGRLLTGPILSSFSCKLRMGSFGGRNIPRGADCSPRCHLRPRVLPYDSRFVSSEPPSPLTR